MPVRKGAIFDKKANCKRRRNYNSPSSRLTTVFGRFPEVLTTKLPKSLDGMSQDEMRDGYQNVLLGFYFYCFISDFIIRNSSICNSLPRHVVRRIRNIIPKDLQFVREAIDNLDPKLIREVPIYTLLRYQESIFRP
jgi:hypothetical protein